MFFYFSRNLFWGASHLDIEPSKSITMKNFLFLSVLGLFFFMSSCDKEENEALSEMNITHIAVEDSYALGQSHDISLTISKPTPCHIIEEEPVVVSGRTYSYHFQIVNKAEVCIQVIKDETVTVDFEPVEAGEHTLNFYINDELYESRTVLVEN